MTTAPDPEVKSLKYAEGLGLNSVYEHVQAVRKELENKHVQLQAARNDRRQQEAFKQDIEMEIAERLRTADPTMSAAAFDRQLKVEIHNHPDLASTRAILLDLAAEIETLSYEVSLLETDVKIDVARLHELGGYFQFMAVLKSTSEARKAREASEARDAEKGPW